MATWQVCLCMNCKVKKAVSVSFFYKCDSVLIIVLSNILIFSAFNIRHDNCIVRM